MQRAFFYTPRSGSKLIARKPSPKVAVFRHMNSSYTVLGGVHVCVGGSNHPPRSLRGEFSTLAELAVNAFGGAAFDEQGSISICLPSEAMPRVWKMFSNVRYSITLSLSPQVAIPLLALPSHSSTPPMEGGDINEDGFIIPRWTGSPSPRLEIGQSGKTYRVQESGSKSEPAWVFGAELLDGEAGPLDPHSAWEAEAKSGTYVSTAKIREFLESRKEVVLEDQADGTYRNARPETWEILEPAVENARQVSTRITVSGVMHYSEDRRFSKTLAKVADFEGFKALTPRPPRTWIEKEAARNVVLRHNGESDENFEWEWKKARDGNYCNDWPEGLVPKDYIATLDRECSAFKAAIEELLLLPGRFDSTPAPDA